MARIDWARVAEPSPYSLDAVASAAALRWPFRTPRSMVAERAGRALAPYLRPADPDCPGALEALRILALWPAGDAAVRSIADAWWPLDQPEFEGCVGGTCGGDEPTASAPRTVIYSTLFDPVGAADGMAHEAGHLRLRALGVRLEDDDGALLTNDPQEEYESPVRRDRLRPMTAVLHAHYSYCMVLAMDRAALAAGVKRAAANVEQNRPRVRAGLAIVGDSARWTRDGEAFWYGLRDWTIRLLR